MAGLAAARAPGRLGGRRPVLNAKKSALAKSLYKDQRNSPSEIAETLGVSRSTRYRYLSPAKYRTRATATKPSPAAVNPTPAAAAKKPAPAKKRKTAAAPPPKQSARTQRAARGRRQPRAGGQPGGGELSVVFCPVLSPPLT